MTEQREPFAQWAILELMGHRRLAGYVGEQEIAGHGFLRIDIYEGDAERPSATQFYAPSSVYAITPTTEPIARNTAKLARPQPVTRWELASVSEPKPATLIKRYDAEGYVIEEVEDLPERPPDHGDDDPSF